MNKIIKCLENFIQLNADDCNWKYKNNQNPKDIYTYQYEGIAGLIPILKKYNIALLSDEVGMGKTFQALSVLAWYYRKNHNLKVLILTPNDIVMRQWCQKAFKNFYNNHLKDPTDFPKWEETKYINNFANGFDLSDKKIVFAKTTSFQFSKSDCETSGVCLSEKDFKKRIRKLKIEIGKFDFIIVDEAHQYRNLGTNRTNNAEEVFGCFWKQENKKLLLLTATPMHSSKDDIKNILSVLYSNSPLLGKNSEDILKKIMIRRLKVMVGKNKYDYRKEEAIPVTLNSQDDYRNELFLAMLQKKYVCADKDKDLSKSKNLLDILEGSNFDKEKEENEKEDENLQSIIDKFQEVYDKTPTNNKYQEVIKHLSQTNEKSLVFVRRIASAYNLSKFYIEEFDKKAWKIIAKALGNENLPFPEKREEFKKYVSKKDKKFLKFLEKPKYIKDTIDKNKEYLVNRNISIKMNNEVRFGLIYEFFNRYDKMKEKDFGTFINEYVENIKQISGNLQKLYEDDKKINDKKIDEKDYIKYAYQYIDSEEENLESFYQVLKEELNKDDNGKQASQNDNELKKSEILDYFTPKTKKGMGNDAVYFKKRFSNNKYFKQFFERDLAGIIFENDENKKKIMQENKFLIKSAVLHASIGLVELYAIYLTTDKDYKKFSDEVIKQKDNLEFIQEIKEFIENIDLFKQNGIYTEDDKENSKIFYGAQPAYPYVADTKNKYVISRFNSPFFPKLLCGTSTLQVGVDLHEFCSKIYHFGAAYTMGDDEQRIGRVDRIKGKLHKELSNKNDTKLMIYYPYLKHTFDETNLKKMLCKKRKTERLIDELKMIINDVEKVCDDEKEFYELNINDLLVVT